MITTLAISFQHTLITLILLSILVGIPIFLIYSVRKSKKDETRLLSNRQIDTIGNEKLVFKIDEDTKEKLEKYGVLSEKTNLILYILTFIFLAIYTTFYILNNRNQERLTDSVYLIGSVVAIIITFVFYIFIFTLLFNPIRRLYRRYLLFTQGIINAVTFKKYRNRSKTWTIILSVICIPLSFGIFGLLMIPHYIFSSNVNKLKL